MIDRMKMVHEIALAVDEEEFYNKAKEFGEQAALSLKRDKRSQITGLENVANNTLKVTDVFNYIKTRTARQNEWRENNFGPDLLKYFEDDLSKKRCELVNTLSIAIGTRDSQKVYISLIREFVRQLAAHYEYALLTQEVPDAAS